MARCVLFYLLLRTVVRDGDRAVDQMRVRGLDVSEGDVVQLTIEGILEVVGLQLEFIDILSDVWVCLLLLLPKGRIQRMRGRNKSNQYQQSCQRNLNPHKN